MSTVPVMTAMDTHNLTKHCDWFGEVNRTKVLDAAECVFQSILPYEQAVPVLIWIFVLLTLLTLLVSALTLFGLRWSEDLSCRPRVFVFGNLILSDLIQTATFAPAVIYSLVQRRTMAFGTWCYVQYFVGTITIFSSLFTITCMALERYLYVCHAIHYLVILSKVRLQLALSLIWVFSISTSIISMVLLHMGIEQNNEHVTRGLLCEPDTVEQHMGSPRAFAVFRKVVGSFTLLGCLLTYAFSYLRMYQDARNAMMPFQAVNSAARKTVLFYCGMLFVQLLPLLLKVASDALWEFEGTVAMVALTSQSQGAPLSIAAVLHVSFLVVLLVPPCINPLVFGLRNVEMRQALFRPFRRLTERRGAGVRGEVWRGVENVRRKGPQAG